LSDNSGNTYPLALWDTSGNEYYKKLRRLSYPETDVFIVCFSVTSLASFNHVSNQWVPELRHFDPEVPVILVGTNIRYRDLWRNVLSESEGWGLAHTVGAVTYLECDAKAGRGVGKILVEVRRGLRAWKVNCLGC
jgi:small GTP-binding protein